MRVSSHELAGIHLFAGLPEEALASIQDSATLSRYSDGQIIMMEGEHQAPVCFVHTGRVRIYRSCSEGREQTMLTIGPGESFYLPCAFASCSDAPASAVAIGPVDVIAVEPAAFRETTVTHPVLATAVLNDLSDKLRHVVCLARDLSLRSVRGRLAQFLMDEHQREREAPIRWTQEQIASCIGSVREVVGRVLRGFIREGLISMQRQRIIILDTEGLRRELL